MKSSIHVVALSLSLAAANAATEFSFKDNPGQALDVLQGDRLVARYMYAHDTSTDARHHETYKPYLHVYDASGQHPITKGPGGEFTHHRGIFIGWNKIQFEGASYDRWHMKGGDIVHQKFTEQSAGADQARFTSLTHWNDNNGQPILVEQRTLAFLPAGAAGRLIVDFESELFAPRGALRLDGDPEHAGVQFRPANDVVRAEATYVFPRAKADPKKDLDYPWVGETFTLNGARHSVVHMNHPSNPKNTKYSAYRDYGRFGAFFVTDIPKDGKLVLRYRFLIADGELPDAAMIQRQWDNFAGVKSPGTAPELTIVGGKSK